MKIQTQATSVLERTSAYLKSGILKQKPAWYDVVANHPPANDLTRKPKTLEYQKYNDPKHKLFDSINNPNSNRTRLSHKDLQNHNNLIHRIPKLKFIEDELRDLFYKTHPWEFSRPKTLIETDGDNNKNCDWSHMIQLTKPLDGESVIQRTLWLLNNNQVNDLEQCYDQARFEFYKLRMEEELQSSISKEESSMYGAIYTNSNLNHGIQQEQIFIDQWADIASDRTKVRRANMSSRNSTGTGNTEELGPSNGGEGKSIFELNESIQQDM